MAKPKQQPFNKGNASAGKMNERELVQRNPSSPFGQGFTAPAQNGASSTSNPMPAKPQKINYKGRLVSAQSDIERIKQGKGQKTIPMLAKPKAKKFNPKND